MLSAIEYAWEGFDMAEISVVTCPQCGKEIKEPGRFCPHCAAPLPQPEQDPNVGYWNFYGVFPDAEPDEENKGLGPRGVLRFAALVVLIAGLIMGFAFSSWGWGFHWDQAWPFWAAGSGAAVLLFLISLLVRPKKK